MSDLGKELLGYTRGNFTFTRELGRGSMGVVFLAQHHFIERKKAVKVLLPEYADDPAKLRRFQGEAMAACACQHDHIVEVEDAGDFELQGRRVHYIEMEFLEGESLGRELSRMPDRRVADLERLARIVADAADALAAAHARGIVHRDIQPPNLFLTRRGRREDYVKVLDFGVALLTGDLSPGARTRTGVRLGQTDYLSPEQTRGLRPDGKSDVFSLGVTLYRAITGEPPFWAESDPLLLLKIANDRPVPILKRRPGTPPALARAVELAMEKDPASRPTMRELRELLLDYDAAPRPVPVREDITTSTPIVRRAPPAITVDPNHVRTPPAQPAVSAVRERRRD